MDRQYMPYWPAGSGQYPPVKEEPDYSKMGYEDTPTGGGGGFNIKREPGVGYEGPPPGGYTANVKIEESNVKQELVEPKQEISDERRGEKRQALNQYGSPEPKRYRPELDKDHVENEPEYDKSAVLLDWYNSDLSLIIDTDTFFSATPLVTQGFGYVWHGVRSTYGFLKGRVYFEVKVEDHLDVPQLEEEEQHPHVIRCGFSIDDAGMTLGEEAFSYGYGGTAKASTNLKFKDYGRPFGKGDVVGCFLDMDSEPIVISFSLNGRSQGICYEVSHHSLQGKALFPHILTKNCSFKVNFGSEYPWFPPLPRYNFIGQVPLQDRVQGTQAPASRQDSEILMMVGLPACGKTTWVEKYCKENLDKKYYVMGTNFLIDKMKVNGLPRKRNYHGRWDVLIDRCTKCLNKLLEMSYKRRRNFIIDQTNVYPSARRRKMKGFPGFYRRAIVVCPSHDELKRRTDKQICQDGKTVPESAVLEMKANFTVPEVEEDLFDAVEFVELEGEEAKKLVEQYSKDAQAAGYVKKSGGFRGRGGGGGFRGGWNRDKRGGFNDRQGSSSGDQDNRNNNNNRGGNNRDSMGGGNRDGQSRDSTDIGNRGFNRGRGGDSHRGGFGRGDDSYRGGFGRGGDNSRGGFGRGGDSRGGFGRSDDNNRGGGGGFGRGGFGNRDGQRSYDMDRNNRDGRGSDNSHGGYNRDNFGSSDRGYNDRSGRDFSRGDDSSRGGFNRDSYGGGRERGSFGQDQYSGSRDIERSFDNNRGGGFGQDSYGGNRDVQRGFGQDSYGGVNRDVQRAGAYDTDRGGQNLNQGSDNSGGVSAGGGGGYNRDNRDNSFGGNDGRGGFNRDMSRSLDRDYTRDSNDSWGGFSKSNRSFSSDRDRDGRSDSHGSNSRGYGSYDSTSRNMGTPRGGQDHADSSGYSSLSSSSGSLSTAGQGYGGNWSRPYNQPQQYWGQSDGGYGSSPHGSVSSQPSYARSSERSSSPSVGGGGGVGIGGGSSGGGVSGGGVSGADGSGGGGSSGGWGQQGVASGGWGGSAPGNQQQWNYGSSYRGQRQ